MGQHMKPNFHSYEYISKMTRVEKTKAEHKTRKMDELRKEPYISDLYKRREGYGGFIQELDRKEAKKYECSTATILKVVTEYADANNLPMARTKHNKARKNEAKR